VVPTTTQQRAGSWFVAFRQNEKVMSACLHQARAIDYRRLSSKLGTIDDEDFARVKDGFRRLIK
jgi:mRNA-degrading endonuclease toxin of MazEF toxin-antitoxin module